MAARIYVVSSKGGDVVRYVRAQNLNSAIRAHSHTLFEARPASAEDIWEASKNGGLDVLDAVSEGDGNGE